MEKTKYYPEVKRYIASRVLNHNDVEDLAQSVFLEFYKNSNHNELLNPQAYLFGIAKNVIAKYSKEKQKQSKNIPIAVIEERHSINVEKDYAERLKKQELKKVLKKSLKKLPLKDYETIRLYLSTSKDFTLKETAKKVQISLPALYKRCQRALQILHKISEDTLKENSE